MATYTAHIEIGHLPGVLDPQGAVVERALPALGYKNVSQVSIGKLITLKIEASDEDTARKQVDEMCQQILANPVIERYDIKIVSA